MDDGLKERKPNCLKHFRPWIGSHWNSLGCHSDGSWEWKLKGGPRKRGLSLFLNDAPTTHSQHFSLLQLTKLFNLLLNMFSRRTFTLKWGLPFDFHVCQELYQFYFTSFQFSFRFLLYKAKQCFIYSTKIFYTKNRLRTSFCEFSLYLLVSSWNCINIHFVLFSFAVVSLSWEVKSSPRKDSASLAFVYRWIRTPDSDSL